VNLTLALIVLVSVALLAAAALVLVVRARRRRARAAARRRPVLPRHPVVLVHGIMGFDEIGLLGSRHDYFRGVVDRLTALGVELHRPRLPAAAPVAERAAVLARFVTGLDARRVNLVAHSMGGIDARYAIHHLGLADRVASLTTIGTPHRGTPLANLSDQKLFRLVQQLAGALGLDTRGMADLTPAAMVRFNREVVDADRVAYGCILAHASRAATVNPFLLATWRYLGHAAGPNDGIVPLASQRWGEELASIEADHWAQVGWSLGFDTAAIYEDLLRELRGRGL
jgi:triacylglycerol lipase